MASSYNWTSLSTLIGWCFREKIITLDYGLNNGCHFLSSSVPPCSTAQGVGIIGWPWSSYQQNHRHHPEDQWLPIWLQNNNWRIKSFLYVVNRQWLKEEAVGWKGTWFLPTDAKEDFWYLLPPSLLLPLAFPFSAPSAFFNWATLSPTTRSGIRKCIHFSCNKIMKAKIHKILKVQK